MSYRSCPDWPELMEIARGGQVLAPGDPTDPVQFIDARDLMEWTIRMIEAKETGVFNATGPEKPLSMGEMLYGIKAITTSGAQFTWVPADFLREQKVLGIEGIDTIESASRSEQSRITIRFRSTVAIDAATSDVRDRVSRVRRSLPDEITEPTISKVEADAQRVIGRKVHQQTDARPQRWRALCPERGQMPAVQRQQPVERIRGRRVDLEVVLTSNRTDVGLGLLADQRTVVQCPGVFI